MRKPTADLIDDARQYVGLDIYPGAILINELADALAAERDRADRAEARLAGAWEDGYAAANGGEDEASGYEISSTNPYRFGATA